MLYMFLADGFEEIEALATLDIIRRAGLEIKTVGVTGDIITGSHGISVLSDCVTGDITADKLDGVILPGGLPGTTNLEKDKIVCEYIEISNNGGLLIAAICAAPSILGHMGILNGKKATCFPGFEDELKGALCSEEFVVQHGNIITAKGAGAALDFGLMIVEYFKGTDFSEELRKTMQCVR